MKRCCMNNCHNCGSEGSGIKVMAERRVFWVLLTLLVADAVRLFCSILWVYLVIQSNSGDQRINIDSGCLTQHFSIRI